MKTKLNFQSEDTAFDRWEILQKGWLRGSVVETPERRHDPVFAYNPVRLAQDLESDTQNGESYVGELADRAANRSTQHVVA